MSTKNSESANLKKSSQLGLQPCRDNSRDYKYFPLYKLIFPIFVKEYEKVYNFGCNYYFLNHYFQTPSCIEEVLKERHFI